MTLTLAPAGPAHLTENDITFDMTAALANVHANLEELFGIDPDDGEPIPAISSISEQGLARSLWEVWMAAIGRNDIAAHRTVFYGPNGPIESSRFELVVVAGGDDADMLLPTVHAIPGPGPDALRVAASYAREARKLIDEDADGWEAIEPALATVFGEIARVWPSFAPKA